jgi:hypothetical protein
MLRISLVSILILMGILLAFWPEAEPNSPMVKIQGVNLEAPRNPVGDSCFTDLQRLGTNWVALVPYGFIGQQPGTVHFNHERQWWGEREEGIRAVAEMAQFNGMDVMLKPHVWIRRDGWPGDYLPENDTEWDTWETTYREYILTYARLAEKTNAKIFCIGTEFRKTATSRPEYWRSLISAVRKVYHGKLTYAANWDNYRKIEFWDDLDYIGIDAYFPLSDKSEPSDEELIEQWEVIAEELEEFSDRWNKNILLTEFGFQSTRGAAGGHWKEPTEADFSKQSQCYETLFASLWEKEWLEGGFVWKWHMEMPHKERWETGFTPQNKPAEQSIRQAWSKQL